MPVMRAVQLRLMARRMHTRLGAAARADSDSARAPATEKTAIGDKFTGTS